MKKSFIYGAMALIGAGLLQSCSDEPAVDVNKYTGVYGSANGGFYSASLDSRTSVDEDNQFNLVREWLGHETVAVLDDATGENLGALANTEAAKSTFSGPLFYDWTSGEHNVTVAYLGEKAAAANRDLKSTIKVDITTQDGSLASLVDHDVQVDHTKLAVTADGWSLNFNIRSVLSFIHYFISLPEGVTYNDETITITGLNSKGTLNLLDGTFSDVDKAASRAVKGIKSTVEGKNGMDLYLAVIPGADQELSFSVEIDHVTYTGTRKPHTFEANVYYRRADGTGGNTPVVNTEERVINYIIDGLRNTTVKEQKATSFTIGDYSEQEADMAALNAAGYTIEKWNEKGTGNKYSHSQTNVLLAPGTHTFELWISKGFAYEWSTGTSTGTAEAGIAKYQTTYMVTHQVPERPGYIFKGWKYNDKIYTDGIEYNMVQEFSSKDRIVFQAVWEEMESSFGVNAGNLPASNPWSNN